MEGKHRRPDRSFLIFGLVLLLGAAVLLTGLGVTAARNRRALLEKEEAERAAYLEEAERIRAEEERALEEAKAESLSKALDSLTLEFVREPENGFIRLEYGLSEMDPKDLLAGYEGVLSVEGPEKLDLALPGDTEFIFTLTTEDGYGQTAEKSFPVTVRVEDSLIPEIEFTAEAPEIEFRSEFDPSSLILSVRDPVDGELRSGDTIGKGFYTVGSTVDTQIPGEYEVRVLAMDSHGNTAESVCSVRVLEKRVMDRPELRGLRYGDEKMPYVVLINRAANTVTVCTKDEEGDTVPVRAMVCSTGPATPRAGSVYKILGRWRWLGLFGPCYGQYATQIIGNILFHSVPYFTQDQSDLEYEEYNKLGTSASMGCIRLCVEDALWIYENIPRGTYVVFYNDAENPGPLGKPVPLTIDPQSPYRGWDPTDPDPENPWHRDGPTPSPMPLPSPSPTATETD